MKVIAAWGSIGAIIGFAIGAILEMASPDGFSCLPGTVLVSPSELTTTLKSMFECWIVVLFSSGVLGVVGAAFGALLGGLGESGRR